jgi:hypothetical protein
MSVRSVMILFAVLCLFGTAARSRADQPDLAPNGRGMGTIDHPTNGNGNSQDPPGQAKPGAGGASGNGINYHGGPVLLNTTNVYYIWYGSWNDGGTSAAILDNFAMSIGGSPYFNINTTYYNGAGTHVMNSVHFGGELTDSGSLGTSLSDTNIRTIVTNAIGPGKLPSDPNGVYFVLTSKEVNKSGFCTSYCGWHTHATIGGSDIKYSFVGDASQCPSACAEQTTSPNGSVGADAMASVIAHELEEAVTDPDLNAWYDRRGYENADKCAWTFGTTYTVSNGSKANMNLGGKDYLIQRNWVNASGGYCALSYP